MKASLVLLIISCLFLHTCKSSSSKSSSPNSTTITYYIDATNGSDSNDGLSESTPWATISKVNSTNFNPNTEILFKRGEIWREQLTVPSSGASSQVITFGAYGSGNQPIISGADTITWVLEAGDIYKKVDIASSSGQAGIVAEYSSGTWTPFTFITWDTDLATTFSGAADKSYSYDYTNNIMYIKTATDPATMTIDVALRNYCIYLNGKNYIKIENITVQHAAFHCIYMTGIDRVALNTTTIHQCGGRWLSTTYLGNGVEWGGSSTNYSLENSTIDKNFDSGASPQINTSNSSQTGFTIYNNTFSNNGMYGIEISVPTEQTNATVNSATVKNNTIYNTGKSWSGDRDGAGISIYTTSTTGDGTSIQNITIQENDIYSNAGDGIRATYQSGPITIKRNKIRSNDEIGIKIYDNSATSTNTCIHANYNLVYNNTKDGFVYYAPQGDDYTLYNNVFYDNGNEGDTTYNFRIFEATSNSKIKNNIFMGVNSLAIYIDNDLKSSSEIDYNIYYRAAGNMIYYAGSAYTNATFNTYKSSMAGADEQNSLSSDPLFTNTGSSDFTLQAGSPGRNNGTNVSLSQDFSGNSVPSSDIDIGAYEN